MLLMPCSMDKCSSLPWVLPSDEDGSADLQYVLAVAESIARHMQGLQGHRQQVHSACWHRRQNAAGASVAQVALAERAARRFVV